MWQALLRNWVMGTARDRLRAAAEQAASGAMDRTRADQPRTAAEHGPPEYKPDVCHVGLVFALPIEAGGLIDRLAGVVRIDGEGFVAREGGLDGRRLVVIESGAGCQAAARAARSLIQGHRPRWIISAGFAGGLDDRLKHGDLLLADEIIDADRHALAIDFKLARESCESMPHLHVGRLLSVDRVIEKSQEKRALGSQYAALAVDMESMGVAEVCRDEKIRFLSVRVVTDAVDRTLPRDIDHLVKTKSTAGRLGAAAGAILRRPSSIKDMWQLKEDALVASERLANFLAGIISQLR